MKRLIVDTANLFFRTCAAHNGANRYGNQPEDIANLALHSCLTGINKWYRQINPDQIIVTFEGAKNWRKAYTQSDKCRSKVLYKGNRVKDPAMEHLFQVISDFERLAREHTSIVCLSAPELEGDDLIAGCAQKFSAMGDEVVILSGDKDFMQLLKLPNVVLLNPENGKPRECEDPDYFIFEKCIRGDAGDNVRSAFPRVRKTRLDKAFTDEYEMTQLMNEQWSFVNPETQEETTYTVKDLFEENQLLMDLEKQPTEIKQIINETIETGLVNHGKFNFFAFSKFLGQHGLVQISENIDKFAKVLSCSPDSVATPKKVGALIF